MDGAGGALPEPCLQPPVLMLSWLLSTQTPSTGASCLAAAALAGLGSPQLLRDVALEATWLSRRGQRGHLSHRDVLLAMKLVLLRELSKLPPGSPSCELPLKEPGKTGQS